MKKAKKIHKPNGCFLYVNDCNNYSFSRRDRI